MSVPQFPYVSLNLNKLIYVKLLQYEALPVIIMTLTIITIIIIIQKVSMSTSTEPLLEQGCHL